MITLRDSSVQGRLYRFRKLVVGGQSLSEG
jgi:hypothetical protein